jgi:hypothetical protein
VIARKKHLQKKHETAIATKKTVAKQTSKKSAAAKNQFKKKLHAMTLSDCD